MVSQTNLASNFKSRNENVNENGKNSKFNFTPTNKSVRTLIEMFEKSPKTSISTISKPGPSTTHHIATATANHNRDPAKNKANQTTRPSTPTTKNRKRKPVLPTFKYRKISDHFGINGRRPDQAIKESDQVKKPTQSKLEVSC